jgi:Raf kinase inhibitor-like YbhB/YbcL family protein
MRRATLIALLALALPLHAQPPASQPPPPPPPGAQPPPGGRGGGRGGGGRGGIVTMALTTDAWPDGGSIPVKYTQAGAQTSPPLSWTSVPEGVASFVLIVHDVDAPIGNGSDDMLHWLVWNIPGSARSLAEGIPQGPELPDRTRQISATGPYYRGPGALANGPAHHYVFELFALDVPSIEVPSVGASPPQTRAAVMAAIAGHVRGKAVLIGLFKRSSS